MRGEEDKCTASDGAGGYSQEIPAGLDSEAGGVTAAGCAAKPCPAFRPWLRFTRLQSLRGFGVSLFERGARLGVFFQGFWGVFITSTRCPLPAGGLGGLAGTLPAAATNNIGNNTVFGKRFLLWSCRLLGVQKFLGKYRLTKLVAGGWEPQISLFHPIPTPVSAFVARCSPSPGAGKVQIFLFFPDPSPSSV